MKNPFKTKKDRAPENLQAIQQVFNQVVFELGDLHYRKYMISRELNKVQDDINSHNQKLDSLGKQAQQLRNKAQSELNKTIQTGETKDEVTE